MPQKLRARTRGGYEASLLWVLVAAFLIFAAWNQSYWWSAIPENYFGWLTPLFVGFVIYDRRVRLGHAWAECGTTPVPRASGMAGLALNGIAYLAFIVGLLAFLAGAAHRAGGGPSIKGTFVSSFGVGLLTLSLPWLTVPSGGASLRIPWRQDPRLKLCGLLIFPAFVWLLSEPLVSVGETRLSSHILSPMAGAISLILNLIGSPVLRQGNILVMPDHGRVGVEEACSGIRSFAACIYAGTFLGAVMLDRFERKIALLALTTAVALVLNFLRSLFLASWAYICGTSSIEGTVHDTAGYLVLGITILSLLVILSRLKRFGDHPGLGQKLEEAGP